MSNKKYVNLTMFDFLKGAGILLVLFRHSIYEMDFLTENIVWPYIYSLLIPMFFVTSGYWLKKRSFREGAVHSLRLFLQPYCIVILCIDCVGLIHRLLQHNLAEWLELFLRQSLLVISGAYSRIGFMWFVFALMIGWILFYGLIQISDERWRIIVSFLICAAGTCLLAFRLPFQLSQGMIAQFFLHAGFLLKKKKVLEKKLPLSVILLLTVLWLAGGHFSFTEIPCDLSMYEFGNGLPAVLFSMCGTFLLIQAGIRINAAENRLVETVGHLGRYTMWILCIHSIEATIVPWDGILGLLSDSAVIRSVLKLVLRSGFIFCGCWLLEKYTRWKREQEGKRMGKSRLEKE